MILIFLLYKDIFILHRIDLFYKYILIGIIPFLFKYTMYSLKDIKEHYIAKIEINYDFISMYDREYNNQEIDWTRTENNKYHNEFLSIKDYVEFKTKTNLYINSHTLYDETPFAKEKIYEDYYEKNNININIKLTDKDHDIINHEFNEKMPLIIKTSIFLEIFDIIKNKKIIVVFMLIINLLYFICWAYVLVISYYKYPINFPFTMMQLYLILKNIEEPFSGLLLFEQILCE